MEVSYEGGMKMFSGTREEFERKPKRHFEQPARPGSNKHLNANWKCKACGKWHKRESVVCDRFSQNEQ